MKKRLSALFATAALLTGSTLTSSAESASAQAPCDSVTISNVSDGVGHFAGTYNLKAAPAMEHENVASGPQRAKFYF